MGDWQEEARTRNFQLWEYHVSHGTLLLRSPKGPNGGPNATMNLDLLCYDTVYVELPRFLTGFEVVVATDEERARISKAGGPRLAKREIRVIASNGQRYAVVASKFVEQEHAKEIMDSPFKS
jgi:hypothetical protein